MTVPSLSMSWYDKKLRVKTVKWLRVCIARVDDFVTDGGIEEEDWITHFNYIFPHSHMKFAPNTELALKQLNISMADEHGSVIEYVHTVRDALVDDMHAIKTAVSADMGGVGNFLGSSFEFKTPFGRNGIGRDVVDALQLELETEKQRLMSLIKKIDVVDNAVLTLANLTECLNAGVSDDDLAPLAKKAKN